MAKEVVPAKLFRVNAGFHYPTNNPEHVVKAGEVVKDKRDLDKMFPNKFTRVYLEGQDPSSIKPIDVSTLKPLPAIIPNPEDDDEEEDTDEVTEHAEAEPVDVTKDFIEATGKSAKVFLMPDETFTIKKGEELLLAEATKGQVKKFLKNFEKE